MAAVAPRPQRRRLRRGHRRRGILRRARVRPTRQVKGPLTHLDHRSIHRSIHLVHWFIHRSIRGSIGPFIRPLTPQLLSSLKSMSGKNQFMYMIDRATRQRSRSRGDGGEFLRDDAHDIGIGRDAVERGANRRRFVSPRRGHVHSLIWSIGPFIGPFIGPLVHSQ